MTRRLTAHPTRRSTKGLVQLPLQRRLWQAEARRGDGDRTIAINGNSTSSDCGAAVSDFALLMTGDLQAA